MTFADAVDTWRRERDGNSMSTVTAPPRPSEMNRRPADTVSVPLWKSTRARSATLTSEARLGSRGLTCTTVSLAVGGDERGLSHSTISTDAVIGCWGSECRHRFSFWVFGCSADPAAEVFVGIARVGDACRRALTVTARTSHAFTESPSARAAASTGDRRLSGSRSVTRQVPPSSSDSGRETRRRFGRLVDRGD